jgi:hypothetical protein
VLAGGQIPLLARAAKTPETVSGDTDETRAFTA